MNRPAAISAQVVDIQNDRLHKGSIKITLHVPAEAGAQLTEALGWPTYAQPVPVALARLNGAVVTEGRSANAPAATTNKMAQRAGILCNEVLFQRFVEFVSGVKINNTTMTANYVRGYCNVSSRAEIIAGTPPGDRFEELLNRYAGWKADAE